MRKRSVVTAAALSLSALLALACGIPDAPLGPDDPVDPDPTTTSAPTPTTTDTGGDSMEGAYTYETMDQYVDAVVSQFMNRWLVDTWPGVGEPFVMYVDSDVSGPQDCTDAEGNPGEYTGFSYEYCPGDETVYVGQDTLWEFYSETGDAGPAMGMAHEYGHHVQYELGVRSPRTAAESVDFENQADCIAGVWGRWMDEQGYLETAEESPNGRGDLDDIELMFPIIASAEGEDDRDHGTLEEREQAFTDGYLGGDSACALV